MTTRAALALALQNKRTVPIWLREARARVLREFEAIARPTKAQRKRSRHLDFKQRGET